MLIPRNTSPTCRCAWASIGGWAASPDQAEIDAFAAELVDRFGKMPVEAEFLLNTVALKLLCRAAGVDKIDAGEKALVFSFHDNKFARPDKADRLDPEECAAGASCGPTTA